MSIPTKEPVITHEPCPICRYPDATCEHLHGTHFWICPRCNDEWEALACYDCEICNAP